VPSKGLALPLAFKSAQDLRPSLERNFRHVVNFVNSYIPTYNDEDTDLYLKGGARASTGFTPTSATHLTTKDYVDTQVSSHNHDSAYVNVSGDTMTGQLVAPSVKLTAGGNPLISVGSGATTGGINYFSFYLADGSTRSAWFGFGANNDSFSLRNERPLGDFFLGLHNGTSVVNRIAVDADGATLLYGSTGAEVFRLQAGYVRLASGVTLQFNGTTVPRLELGANNSIQVTTPSGWLQIGPQNTTYCHIYTDRGSFYFNKSVLYANGSLIWHAGNDGSGSGLDADLLDGVQGASFARADANDTITGTWYTSNMFPRANATYVVGSSTTYYAAHAASAIYRNSEYTLSSGAFKNLSGFDVPGIDLIRSLKVVAFRYKQEQLNEDCDYRLGLIAEDVAYALDKCGYGAKASSLIHEAEVPDELDETDRKYPHINDSQLMYVILNAVKQLDERLMRLENG